MHLSTVDIAVFPVSRGAALVGPRAAFGLRRVGDMLRTYQEVRSVFDRLTIQETSQLLLRSYFRRWGLEPELRISRDHAAMSKWLTDQTVRGRLGVLPVPDSALAFAGRSQSQMTTIAHAEAAADYEAKDDEPFPHRVEARFVGVLFLVPQHMSGAIRVEYAEIVRKLGRAKIAGRLLAWIGPSYMQGSDLSVLASLCRTVTAELIEAMDDLVDAIDETAHAVNAQDLARIAPKVARAFSPMIEHSVLERLLEPREILGSQGRRKAGDGGKPNVAKKAPRAVARGPIAKPPQKKAEEKKEPPAKKTDTPPKKEVPPKDDAPPPPKDEGLPPAPKDEAPHPPPKKSGVKTKEEFDTAYGKSFKSKPEADAAWEAYKLASETPNQLVIGRLPDTQAGEALGMTRLNTPNWTLKVNDAFMQGAMDAGKSLYLGSAPTPENFFNPPGSPYPETVFKREYDQLVKAGYKKVGDMMVPPGSGT